VCDTVRCGETAVFSIRDGGSCAAGPPGVWPMKDGSNMHTLTCAPASGDDPCSGCAGSADLNGCRWTWKAPKDDKAAAALVTPSNQQCRCTDYKPASVKEWLCSALTGCPGAPGDLAAATCPAQEYPGTRRCWLRDNWANVLKLQGLGPAVDGIVLGGGDRSVTLNLAAIECACTAWGLTTKTIAVKDPPCVPLGRAGTGTAGCRHGTPLLPPHAAALALHAEHGHLRPSATNPAAALHLAFLPDRPEPPAITCPAENDPDDPPQNCTLPTWKHGVAGEASAGCPLAMPCGEAPGPSPAAYQLHTASSCDRVRPRTLAACHLPTSAPPPSLFPCHPSLLSAGWLLHLPWLHLEDHDCLRRQRQWRLLGQMLC
jgi:hypothetical protein